MVDINLKKLPPLTEGSSWPLPNLPISMWAEVMTSFCVLYGVISLKRSIATGSQSSVVWGCLGSRGKGLNWKKPSPDPYRIRSSEILDLSILPDSGHEYLIF